jgi:hypothetical protein
LDLPCVVHALVFSICSLFIPEPGLTVAKIRPYLEGHKYVLGHDLGFDLIVRVW